MPISARSMMIAGHVSPSAYRRHVRDMKGGDEQAQGKQLGEVLADHIDAEQRTSAGSPERASGLPSRGGQARGGSPMTGRNAINKRTNKKKFPPGKNMTGAGNPSGPSGRTRAARASAVCHGRCTTTTIEADHYGAQKQYRTGLRSDEMDLNGSHKRCSALERSGSLAR